MVQSKNCQFHVVGIIEHKNTTIIVTFGVATHVCVNPWKIVAMLLMILDIFVFSRNHSQSGVDQTLKKTSGFESLPVETFRHFQNSESIRVTTC